MIFQYFEVKKWIRYFLFLLCAFLALTACTNDSGLKEPPITLPLTVYPEGSQLEIDFAVSEKSLYAFELKFMYRENDLEDLERVRKLSGGNQKDRNGVLRTPGEPLTLQLKLQRFEQDQTIDMFDKEIKTHTIGTTGLEADSVSKEIDALHLDKGHYRAVVKIVQAAPVLEGARINFAIIFAFRIIPPEKSWIRDIIFH